VKNLRDLELLEIAHADDRCRDPGLLAIQLSATWAALVGFGRQPPVPVRTGAERLAAARLGARIRTNVM